MNTLFSVFTMFVAAAAAGPPADAPGASESNGGVPVAAPKPLTFEVDENSASGTSVGTVTFDSPGRADQIEFHLAEGNALEAFALDRSTGRLTVRNSSAVDFEARPVFELIVEVRKTNAGRDVLRNSFQARLRQSGVDVGAVEKLSVLARVPVTVRLRDVNEGLVFSAVDFRLREDAAAGAVLGTLGDANRSLTFSVLAGNDYAMFDVDRRTGEVRLEDASLLDFEQQSLYRLAVEVADATGARVLGEVTVAVDDVNEPPFAAPQRFQVEENATAGTDLGAVRATDPDRNDELCYELVAGDKSAPFDIDPTNGRLRVNGSAALDFENCPRFDLIVRAYDLAGADVRIPVVIEVTEFDAPAIAPHPFQALEVPPVPEWAATDEPAAPNRPTSEAAPPTIVRRDPPMLSFASFGIAVVCLVVYTAGVFGLLPHGRDAEGLSTDERKRLKARILELETIILQLEDQRNELAQTNDRLETEREELTKQLQSVDERQTQLKRECDRVLAEADAVSQMRSLLEQQRIQLDGEREQLEQLRRDLQEEQGCLRGMLTGDVDDLDEFETEDFGANERFEFDDDPDADGRDVSTGPGEGAPAAVPAIDEARLDELRSNLAGAFGVAYSDGSTETAPAEPQFEAAATIAVEDGPEFDESGETEPGGEGEPDNIATYMQALLKRTRGGDDSGSSRQRAKPSNHATNATAAPTAAATGSTAVAGTAPALETTAATATETATQSAPARQRAIIDKHAVRQGLDSMRQVANLDARSALSQHALKRRKRRMVFTGSLGTISLVAAAILLPADWFGGVSVACYGWVAVGFAVLMAVEFSRLVKLKYEVRALSSSVSKADAGESNDEDVQEGA